MTNRFDEGMKLRRQVLGDAHVDRSFAEAKDDDFVGPLQELVTELAWGTIWTRGELDLKTRSIMNLAMLTALNRPHEFETHLRGAIRNGVTKAQVREILLHTSAYCGWPAAIDSFRIARRMFKEMEAGQGESGTPAPAARDH